MKAPVGWHVRTGDPAGPRGSALPPVRAFRSPASLSTEQTAGPVPTATRQPPPCPSVLPGPESAARGTLVSADPARRASELPAWAPRRGSCWPAAGSAHRQATPRCLPGGWQCAQLSSSLSCVWTCLLLHTQSRTHIYTGPHVYTTHTHTHASAYTRAHVHTQRHTHAQAHTHNTRTHAHTQAPAARGLAFPHSPSHCMARGSSTSPSLSFPTSHVMFGEHLLKNVFFNEETKPRCCEASWDLIQ